MTITALRPSQVSDQLGDLAVRMSAALLGDDTGASAIKVLTSLSITVVPNAIGAGLTLIDAAGVPTSHAATNDGVLEADALQYFRNQGPCLDACREATPVHVADLSVESRWPTWTRAVRPLNIAALMSVPLTDSGRVLGSFKIYCDVPGAFDERTTATFGEIAQSIARLVEQPA